MNERLQKPTDKDELVAWRLRNMACYATDPDYQRLDHAGLAEQGKYIRIQGESVRLISLDPKTPLGKLQIDGKDLGNSTNLSKLIQKIDLAQRHEPDPNSKPGEERAMQAFIIKAAFGKNRSLASLFPDLNKNGFDELTFICDELSVGDRTTRPQGEMCRADVIALGKKDGIYFPVFIELKYSRALKRLKKQLADIQTEMDKDNVRPNFLKFLEAVSGVNKNLIEHRQAKKMVIWPKFKGVTESKNVLDAKDDVGDRITFVEYEIGVDSSFKFHTKRGKLS